jgi:membrane associated rhomboid family serine protease
MAQPRYRDTSVSSIFPPFPPGIKWLIIVNVAVFIPYFIGGRALHDAMTTWLALYPETLFKLGFVWQLVTYLFLHGDPTHILFNMLALWFFGSMLEQTWGTRRFVKYYFYCGIAAGVCVTLAGLMELNPPVTIGASGAVFGVLIAFGVLFPDMPVLLAFLFPIKAKYMVMIMAGIELLLTLRPSTGISTIAHLGGMAFGYLYVKRRIPMLGIPDVRAAYNRWRLARAKRKFQVYVKKRGGPWVN